MQPVKQNLLKNRTQVAKKIYDLFVGYADREPTGKARKCYFQFLRSPVEISGDGRVEKLTIEHNQLSGEAFKQSARGTGETYDLDTGILFRSIGYRGVEMPGVPFHDSWGVFPNEGGRITENDAVVPGMYTAGWIKRGPSGIIGTNRACAVETVNALVEDVAKLDAGEKPGRQKVYEILDSRGVKYINYDQWKTIDQVEIERGEPKGKPREKITSVNEMISLVS